MRVLAILALGALAYAADPREAQITAADASFDRCWQMRDIECLSRLVTDDFVQITRNARLTDKAGLLEGMKAGTYNQRAPNTEHPPLRELRIRFYGNTAVETYVNTALGSFAGMDQYCTKVWVTVDTQAWRLASMHSSLPPARSPQ